MGIQKIVTSDLPTIYGRFSVHAYESNSLDYPHLALVHQSTNKNLPVAVRIHSECMTGDVFGSVRCDCGEQLAAAMEYLEQHGGILIYLRQEGRGIGLTNKLKAYNLQDQGLDTIKANHALGFHTDERDYTAATEILKDLGITSVKVLTNNPDKLDALTQAGIEIAERIPLLIEPRPENRHYLHTKRVSLGHLLSGENV